MFFVPGNSADVDTLAEHLVEVHKERSLGLYDFGTGTQAGLRQLDDFRTFVLTVGVVVPNWQFIFFFFLISFLLL
jgi:hypothetical protein